ncbi:hypothetical protein VSDG_01189 [Cytospora chrysosperma]|uniref:BTB domain-containing protein n=1 Tax=Cytospora chrysosperma TaxID=252740 RepID=A0A423WL64_CYTCH|nr:hypothetical protein VSDG_01189 [Valsa sordida]
MPGNRKRKLGQIDGSDTKPQFPTRQKMDVPASLSENKAEEGDVKSPLTTTDTSSFGGRHVIIAVGPDKTKFYIHEQVLSKVAKNSHFDTACNNSRIDTVTGCPELEFPDMDPQVFEILVKWIYATHAGIDEFCDIFTPLNMITHFKLYVVAHNHLVYGIQDSIMSYLFYELGDARSVWSKIGSDKKAIECFIADVSESSHLYRLVVRAMAYSILQPTSAHNDNNNLVSDGDVFRGLRIPVKTKAQAKGFLRAVPDKVCRSIVEIILNPTYIVDQPKDKMSDTQATKPEMGNRYHRCWCQKKIQYFVHEQVLAKREAGRFFNKVFTNGFQETQTRYLALPEDDPDAFDVFLKWLYGSYRTGNTEASTELFRDRDGTQLIRYYILAHKYLINSLQNHVMSALYDMMCKILWWEADISRDILEQDRPEITIDDFVDALPEELLRLVTKEMFKVETPDETDRFIDFCGEANDYLLRGD